MEENTLINFNNTLQVLGEYAMTVRNLYQDKLITNEHIASGKLLNSVEYIVTNGQRDISVSLKLDEVWKYVENDTKPHWPPLDKILEWVTIKPVLPSKTFDGKLPTQKQLAFLISRKISEVGTKGTHDLQQTLQEVNAIYEQRIGEAITKDIEGSLSAIITMFNTK